MVTSAGATTVQNLTYGYDPAGNVNPLTDNLVPVRSFSYLPTGQAANDNRDPSHAYVYNYNKGLDIEIS